MLATRKTKCFPPYVLNHHSESLMYDTDGNLISDGRWAYTWDAEPHFTGHFTRPFTMLSSHL